MRVQQPLGMMHVRCELGGLEAAAARGDDAVSGEEVLHVGEHRDLGFENVREAVDGHPGAFGARVDLDVGGFVFGAGAFVATRGRGDAEVCGDVDVAGCGSAPGAVGPEIVGDPLDSGTEGVRVGVVEGDGSDGRGPH